MPLPMTKKADPYRRIRDIAYRTEDAARLLRQLILLGLPVTREGLVEAALHCGWSNSDYRHSIVVMAAKWIEPPPARDN